MQTFSAWLGRLALWLLLLGTVGMIAAMLVGVADVVGTEFLGRPVLGTLEFTESTMVLVVFGALAYAQERRAHIRVELLYSFVGPRGKSFMEAVTHIVAFIFFALVAWQGYVELLYSWEIKESTMGSVRFPLYPARVLLLVGVALLLLRLAIDIAQDIGRLRRGEPPPEAALPEQRE
ncbi:MAG TPA: TRAP transporter small permease [Burkholderiales bacterium]|jgi:TRAP-type C4-dicarboxylate transport system permease small subunit